MATFNSAHRDLLVRAASGSLIVLAVLGSIHSGGMYWAALCFSLSFLSLNEFYRILGRQLKLSRGIGYIAACVVMISAYHGARSFSLYLTLSLATFAVLLIEILRRQFSGNSSAVSNIGGLVTGILFIVVPWTCIFMLRELPSGKYLLFAMFACTWSCDVFAYIMGSRWGRTSLCDNVSPKKTWEGFIGGVAGSLLSAGLFAYEIDLPPAPILYIGIICGIVGQMGDLAESLLKREYGVKDSGDAIPGHGGVLDRFDSILINGILTYFLFAVVLR